MKHHFVLYFKTLTCLFSLGFWSSQKLFVGSGYKYFYFNCIEIDINVIGDRDVKLYLAYNFKMRTC